MDLTPLLDKLHGGHPLFDTLIVSPSPMWPAALEGSGLDFVFIDTEGQSALDRAQVSWMCQAYARTGLPPLVRIPSPDPFAATRALDGERRGSSLRTWKRRNKCRPCADVKLRPIKGRRLANRLGGAAFEPALEEYLCRQNTAGADRQHRETPLSMPSTRSWRCPAWTPC